MMSEKRFRKLQGYMADNNRKCDNGDVYAMDFTEVEDMLNALHEENEQLKKAEKINMEYAEQIVEEIKKLRIVKNDLRIENKQLQKENERLRTQLLICQQSKNDDGRFRVWQVPPIQKGMRIIIASGDIK